MEAKKAFVTEKLQKRDEERHADLQKRKNEKESTAAANENVGIFIKTFNGFKVDLESKLVTIGGGEISKTDLQSHFDEMSLSIQNMQKYLSDATIFLAPYEIKKSQNIISKLQKEIQTKRDELIPQKKFAFKGKKKTESVPKDESKKSQNGQGREISVDMVDCGFSNKTQEVLRKENDEINNKDIALSNLENCTVQLVGYPSAIHMDNLKNCKILSGPVSGSIFLDNCDNCEFVLACQQLRIHSTTASKFYIHVTSKAIIEDCHGVEFAPYSLKYEGIDSDYRHSGLDKERNNWSHVDDFNWLASDTPSPYWKVMSETSRVSNWEL